MPYKWCIGASFGSPRMKEPRINGPLFGKMADPGADVFDMPGVKLTFRLNVRKKFQGGVG